MDDLLKRFSQLSSAVLSDCLRGMHTLDSGIHNMTPGLKLAGPAFTVLAEAGSIITVHKALLEAPAGSVLVVGGETAHELNGALFGKLMAIQAGILGFAGLVVDGAVRDIAEVRELGFPVFARCTTPRVGVNRTVGQTQVPTPCGGIVVSPGDFVRGDDDGVTIIPADLVEQVVMAAEKRLQEEAEYVQAMRGGAHLTDLIGFKKLIIPEERNS
jgi:4-hydroxy-4-methyl-2-oxoglutarate aldolase